MKITLCEPYDCVDLLDGMLDLVVRVCRLDTQLENQPVNFVDDKSHLDTLLETVADDVFGVHHDLGAESAKRVMGS